MALSITFDHAQRRVIDDRISLVAGGLEFEGPYWSDTWIDPVTNTLMLRPYPLYDAWYTTDTGNYAKLTATDFSLSGTDWETRYDQHAKGPWLCRKDAATNGTAITSSAYAKNRGMYVSWFSYGAGEVFLQFRCGWNSSASTAGGVAIEVYSDGFCNVYKNGAVVASGKVSGSQTQNTRANQVYELLLIPCRHRELLIYSKSGDGFSVAFPDIDDDDADPTIVPAQKFWFEVVEGATQVMVAPLSFPTSGYATSVEMTFLEAPAVAEPLEEYENDAWVGAASPDTFKIYGHSAYVGTQTAAAEMRTIAHAAFTPDGTTKEVRLRVDLTTNNAGYTPFVYGAQMAYAGYTDLTDSTESFDATGSCMSASLSVSEDAGGVYADFEFINPDGLEADVAGLFSQSNRPIELLVGTQELLDGVGLPPRYDVQHNLAAEVISFEVRDKWKLLEDYIFAERVPIGGLTLVEALTFFAKRAGFEATDITITASAFVLPEAGGAKAGEWNLLVEPGDTAADWIRRLMDDYAATWYYGIRPKAGGYEFYAEDTTDLGTTAGVTLYETSAEAVSIGLHAAGDAWQYVARAIEEAVLEPLANDVRITGYDPRTKRPIQSHKQDTASIDATTSPSLRPANWLGVQRKFGLADTTITTQAACDQACEISFDRLSVSRRMIEFKCGLLVDGITGVPLWRGDVVEIYNRAKVRINSFHVSFMLEDGTLQFREALYTGEVFEVPS